MVCPSSSARRSLAGAISAPACCSEEPYAQCYGRTAGMPRLLPDLQRELNPIDG